MANYDGQGDDYTRYTNSSAVVTLAAAVNTFGYIERSAVIIVRGVAESINPATQYNLGVLWSLELAGRLEAGQSATSTNAKPSEQWT
jgi:hypothetical protein